MLLQLEGKETKGPRVSADKAMAGCCCQWEGRRLPRCREGRQDPEGGLVAGQLRAHSMTNISVRYVKMTSRRVTSSRKDDTKDDSLQSQKEATHSKD